MGLVIVNYNLTSSPGSYYLNPGDSVTATNNTIVPGDILQGANSNNVLYLSGPGTFDLTQPEMAGGGYISGFTSIEEQDPDQAVTLVAGMPIAVIVDPAGGNETVTLANDGDSFNGGGTSGNSIYAAASLFVNATSGAGISITGGSGSSDDSLNLTGSGDVDLNNLNVSVSNIDYVYLQGSGVTFNDAGQSFTDISFQGGNNTLIESAGDQTVIDDTNGGNYVLFENTSDTLQVNPTNGAGLSSADTLFGFDSSDSIQLDNLNSSGTSLNTSFNAATDTETVTVTGTNGADDPTTDTFSFRGDYSGTFSVSDSGIPTLTYSDAQPSDVAFLTAGSDTVNSDFADVVATDGTLSTGDQINPTGGGAILELVGAGTFDLTQPQSLTNISQVVVDSPDANVTLLSGLEVPVTLSTAGDDTVTLANNNDSINVNGGVGDLIIATPTEADGASIGGGSGATLDIEATGNNSGQAITLSQNLSAVQYVSLDGSDNTLDPSQADPGPSLAYIEDSSGVGGNTIELTGNLNAALDYGDSSGGGDNFFFDPNSDAPQSVSIVYENAPTENLFGFAPDNDSVVLSPFSSSTNVAVTATSGSLGPGVAVTITGLDASGNTITQTLQLYGDYPATTSASDFTLAPNSGGSGLVLTYTPTSGTYVNAVGSQDGNYSVSGVSDAYLAAGQANGDDSIATNSGGTLQLIGPGSFVLNNLSDPLTGIATIDSASANQSITLQSVLGSPGSPSTGPAVTVNISGGNDVLYNLTQDSIINGGTTGNNYGTAYSFDINSLEGNFGSGGNNQIQIEDTNYNLTLNNPNLTNVESFAIVNDGDISIDTGNYGSTSGAPVNIDIAVSESVTTPGADNVTLQGNGDSASDFIGGNVINMLGANETFYDDRAFGNLANPETISGFDQGASQNDTIAMPLPDTVDIATSFNAMTDTTTLTMSGSEFGNPYTSQIILDGGDYNGTFTETKIPGFSNGWDLTYSAPCYLQGTRILTETGYRAIETLAIGERVITASTGSQAIRWIGRRSYGAGCVAGNRALLPVLIRAGALAAAVPQRDLRVSPEHALSIDDVLIPAALLTNGRTIDQPEFDAPVTYYHLEFAEHEVIFAEGAPAESFVDDESRVQFDNAFEYEALYPDAVRQPARFCAPRVEDGYELEAIRNRLARRADILADDLAPAEPATNPTRGNRVSYNIEQ
jgi:Hint domain